AFNPLDNQLWGSVRNPIGTPKDRIIKIDLLTGDTLRVGQTGFAVNTTALTFDESGQLFGIKGTASAANDLFSIDTMTAVGTIIGSIGVADLKAFGYSLASITSIEDNSIKSPSNFILDQNYPNPFNPSTQIKFSLPISSNVRITIYNLLGEVVRELLNTDMNSGVHTIQWNSDDASGRKVSSGIYFYELNANGVNGNQFNQVRKMILMK
ncbi:MAG TPA: FlgD immunoglobulin-like domain containing protein, partial [Ignavibacteriaceae bacterium]